MWPGDTELKFECLKATLITTFYSTVLGKLGANLEAFLASANRELGTSFSQTDVDKLERALESGNREEVRLAGGPFLQMLEHSKLMHMVFEPMREWIKQRLAEAKTIDLNTLIPEMADTWLTPFFFASVIVMVQNELKQ